MEKVSAGALRAAKALAGIIRFPAPEWFMKNPEQAAAIIDRETGAKELAQFAEWIVKEDHAKHCSETACVATCVNGRAALKKFCGE